MSDRPIPRRPRPLRPPSRPSRGRRVTALAASTALLASLLGGAAAPALADAPSPDALPAFPGAEGFGYAATGGRGGEVYHVTSKELTGEGTLHHALTTSGEVPRTIVFDVSGNLEIPQIIVQDASNITIAGQTAPGGGVTVLGNTIRIIDSHDIVVRHLRFRMGKHPDVNDDTMYVENSQNVIIDHSSFSWGTDEVLSIKSKDYENPTSENITVQWSIMSEGLLTHSMGGLVEMNTISMHHNLYAHNNDRNPKTKGVMDFVGNTVYNWGDYPYVAGGESGTKGYGNVVGNTFIAGANSRNPEDAIVRGNENYQVHIDGNVVDGDRDGVLDGEVGGEEILEEERPAVVVPERFAYPPVHTQEALEAHEMVLEHAGASLTRDPVDERVITSVREQSGGIIEHQDDVGGYPAIEEADPPKDSDRDGMPDRWERRNQLDPHDPEDRNHDADGDGYTNLEEYLNELAAPSFPEGYPMTPAPWDGEVFEPPAAPEPEEEPAAPPAPLDGTIIRGGVVNDTSGSGADNATDWSVQEDLQVGDVVAGDRSGYTFTEVPGEVAGAEWIRTAVDSRASDAEDTLRFHAAADARVYVAHDTRIPEQPAWLAEDYEATGLQLQDTQPVTWELFSRDVRAGDEVILGPNAGGNRMNYLVVVVPTAPSGEVPAPPAEAPEVTADPAAGTVEITWEPAADATSVLVERSTAGDPAWRVIGSSADGALTDDAPQLGVRHDYRIVPVAAGGAAEASPHASVTPVDPSVPVPEAPAGLEITGIGSYGASLSWDAVDGAEGYVLQRAAGPDGAFTDVAGTASTSAEDDTVEPATDYRYRVLARTAGGLSDPSAEVSATSGPAMEIPAAPTAPVLTEQGPAHTALGWDAVDGAQEYVVLRTADGETAATEIARTEETSYVDDSLSAGSSGYSYRIVAANERGASEPGEALTVPSLVPEAPSALEATLRGDTFVGVTWDRGAGTDTVEVLREIDGEPAVVASGKVSTTYVRDLEPGTEYTLWVRGTNAAGPSELSEPLTVSTLPERWSAEQTYQRGDRAGHDGAVWEATRRTQGDRPGTSGSWTRIDEG
ncbi:pectinesterase [Brachybacterium sp. YJGR34]|uniref:fibronectin type III domain-containing protein n=1 Tax=Brachybacterium sp. YJGR34 TaxID=2059911 RepID=UPI000E0B549A|nr:pectinesterase [Brachybacterium sp. YJGR34]